MGRLRQEWNFHRPQSEDPIWTRRPRSQETIVLDAEEAQRWQAEEDFRKDVEQFARRIIETSEGVTKAVLIRRFGRLTPLAEIHSTRNSLRP